MIRLDNDENDELRMRRIRKISEYLQWNLKPPGKIAESLQWNYKPPS